MTTFICIYFGISISVFFLAATLMFLYLKKVLEHAKKFSIVQKRCILFLGVVVFPLIIWVLWLPLLIFIINKFSKTVQFKHLKKKFFK